MALSKAHQTLHLWHDMTIQVVTAVLSGTDLLTKTAMHVGSCDEALRSMPILLHLFTCLHSSCL